jgi:hypothetical protein
MKNLLFALVFLTPSFLHAETGSVSAADKEKLTTSMDSVLEIIQKLLLDGGLPVGGLVLGGCTPAMRVGIPYVRFDFFETLTCPISGDTTFSLFPTRAQVHLDSNTLPLIESVDFDATYTIRKIDGQRVTVFDLKEGRLGFRVLPGFPRNDWILNGHGERRKDLKTKSLVGKMRINYYEKSTGKGKTLLKEVTRELKGAPKSKTKYTCELTGATESDWQSGVVSNCRIR